MMENRRRKINTALIGEGSDSLDVTEEKIDEFKEEEIVKESKSKKGECPG